MANRGRLAGRKGRPKSFRSWGYLLNSRGGGVGGRGAESAGTLRNEAKVHFSLIRKMGGEKL